MVELLTIKMVQRLGGYDKWYKKKDLTEWKITFVNTNEPF